MERIAGTADDFFVMQQQDPVNKQFGLADVAPEPMAVQAVVLPPVKLQYGNAILEPGLSGSWNLANHVNFLPCESKKERHQTARDSSSSSSSSSNKESDGYTIAVYFVHRGPDEKRISPDMMNMLEQFEKRLLEESERVGTPLFSIFRRLQLVRPEMASLNAEFEYCAKSSKPVKLMVLINEDKNDYNVLKVCGDSWGVPTQCVKLETLRRAPKGLYTNIMMKIHNKLGGPDRCLASRAKPGERIDSDVFQKPPKSMPWQLDEITMIVVRLKYHAASIT